MVKLYCDRCGKEIKDKYLTINFWEYDINARYEISTVADCSLSSYNRTSALQELNSQKMYCKHCIEEVKKFIRPIPEVVE